MKRTYQTHVDGTEPGGWKSVDAESGSKAALIAANANNEAAAKLARGEAVSVFVAAPGMAKNEDGTPREVMKYNIERTVEQ